MQTFGEVLRQAREEAGVTMGELARHLGVSVPYMSDVERGKKPPLVGPRLEQAARYIGADVRKLTIAAGRSRGAFEIPATGQADADESLAVLARGWSSISSDSAKIARLRDLLHSFEDD
jgi:transcriptional regulator with XRE-family HTH domain